MFRINKGMWTIGIPILLSSLTIIKHSVFIFILFILAHFIVLRITPAFRHRENIWMFVIVAFSSIPINLYLFGLLYEMELLFDSFFLLNIIRGILYYIVILSIEEIIMGTVTRLLWKKQYKPIE